MTVRRRYVIHGRVQGVFFRASTRDAARRAGATGWVRNEPDGTVVAEVQGSPDTVADVEAFLNVGPSSAIVERVERSELDPVDGEMGFAVAG